MIDLKKLTVDDLAEEFDACWNWNEKYRYIVELGRSLPKLEESEKSDENLVDGCQSRAWIVAAIHENGSETRIDINADSDALIAKGLIAILVVVFSGHTPKEILGTDVSSLFEKLELQKHLTPIRGNGLLAMVNRIRHLAEQHQG